MKQHLASLTLHALFKHSTVAHRDRVGLAELDGASYTYEALARKVAAVTELLEKQGVVPGDRVAILSENKPQWGISYFAITTMGAVAVPILPDFHTSEVVHILRHSEAKAVLVSEKLHNKIEDADLTSLQTIISLEDFAILPAKTNTDRFHELLQEGSKEFSKLKQAALKFTGRRPAEVQEDDLASIIYTSGTTGHSKGVMLTHRNIVYDALATMEIVPVGPEDRMLSILPLSHAYECTLGLVAPIMMGGSVYYLDKPPTARVLLPALEKVKPTIMLTVPLVIEKIFKTKILPQFKGKLLVRGLYKIPVVRKKLHKLAGKKLVHSFGGRLQCFCIGGASLSPDVELFLREAGFPYAIGYGLTETAPLIFGTNPQHTVYRSTGPALTGIEFKIDQPNPRTQEGEICVRGPVIMKGYYKDPSRTAETIDKEGWLHTGDLGVLDTNNYLFIKGRLKNMILGPSGENIYPEEIEAVINESEEVLESLVYERDGRLTARVYLNNEELETRFSAFKADEGKVQEKIQELLEDIRTRVNEQVSAFSRIHKIIQQAEPFEKTPTQKIKRYLYV